MCLRRAFAPWKGHLRMTKVRASYASWRFQFRKKRGGTDVRCTPAYHLGRPKDPSIDAPWPSFLERASFEMTSRRKYLVKAFATSIAYRADRIELTCCFPMPFFKSADIELAGSDVQYAVKSEPLRDAAQSGRIFPRDLSRSSDAGARQGFGAAGYARREGGGDWSGSFVGTSFIFSHNAVLNTLEGDPRFFFDDSESPQGQGTGTEEWGGGGDYWGGKNMTLPFAGHPCGAKSAKEAKCDEDKIESAYRFLLADLFPFGKNAKICLEHGGTNESKEHYETVTYWYGLPAASLVKTDYPSTRRRRKRKVARLCVSRCIGAVPNHIAI